MVNGCLLVIKQKGDKNFNHSGFRTVHFFTTPLHCTGTAYVYVLDLSNAASLINHHVHKCLNDHQCRKRPVMVKKASLDITIIVVYV